MDGTVPSWYEITLFSSSVNVVFISLIILNTFENKKGIIKILVYKSVIDIIQIDVIIFAS